MATKIGTIIKNLATYRCVNTSTILTWEQKNMVPTHVLLNRGKKGSEKRTIKDLKKSRENVWCNVFWNPCFIYLLSLLPWTKKTLQEMLHHLRFMVW